MIRKMNIFKLITTALLLCCESLAQSVLAAPSAPPAQQPAGYDNAAVQLNRAREYMERQRVARQIEEDRARERARVEGQPAAGQEQQTGSLRFVLQKLEFDASAVLSAGELQKIADAYAGREISIAELYKAVGEVNSLYTAKGYLTCRAFLQPQTIKDGTVHITLIEGRTGSVAVQGNASTTEKYITKKLHLDKGSVPNVNTLNKDLLLFNASNDVQLRIMMQAGAEPGTTDYVITAYEPQLQNFSVYGDNSGSASSGEWRGGLFYNNRSLNGRRDSISLSTIFSEGTKAFSGMYVTPLGRSGTKLGLNFSTNSVHIVDGGLQDMQVRGHSSAYGVSLSQPLLVTEHLRSEASLEYGRQDSRTDFLGIRWIDDSINRYTASFSMTNYGGSSIIYQRHGYSAGSFRNLTGESRGFGKYIFNGMYQKSYRHGQTWSARLDAQYSSTDYLVTAEQFYIGGMNSVRGYKESLLGGDHGLAASLEYAVPLDKKRRASAFAFFDYGSVHGSSAFDDHILAGTGVGVKALIKKHLYLTAALGVPLRRELNGTEVSKTRVHCLLNGQF